MALSALEKKILAALTSNHEIGLTAISRKLGLKEHTVRYHAKQLLDHGVLQRFPVYDLRRLGLQHYNVFFTTTSSSREKLLAAAARDPRILWLAENVGERSLELTAALSEPEELTQVLTAIADSTRAPLLNREVAIEVGHYLFGSRYLCPDVPARCLTMEGASSIYEYDDLDIRLLTAAAKIGITGHTQALSRALGKPSSTIDYRIKKLFSESVILSDRYFVAADRIELHEYQILVRLKSLGASIHRALFKFCERQPSVASLICGVGAWDYKLVLRAEQVEGIVTAKEQFELELSDYIAQALLCQRRRVLKSTFELDRHPALVSAPAPKPRVRG